jgi:uncharacterized protein YndB with AHSA1/START domain
MNDFPSARELILDRLLDAPRQAVFRCWTEADLVKQWFAPAPFSVAEATLDPRVGGANSISMKTPDGQVMPSQGVFLEVVQDERIVFTDAFAAGWQPREGTPFMVVSITLSDEGRKTRYIARARHWSEESTQQHEAMGFHAGWSLCADQLEALARTL